MKLADLLRHPSCEFKGILSKLDSYIVSSIFDEVLNCEESNYLIDYVYQLIEEEHFFMVDTDFEDETAIYYQSLNLIYYETII